MTCQKVCKQGRDDIIGARCARPTLASWLKDSRYVCMYVCMYVQYVRDSIYLFDLFKLQVWARDHVRPHNALHSPGSESKFTKPYPYIFLHYSCRLMWKQCRDEALYIYLHYYIIPTLFAYFLACHPYILLHF